MTIKKCKCRSPDLLFKRYDFREDDYAYRGTCKTCGLLRAWFNGNKYRVLKGGKIATGGTPNFRREVKK